MNDDPLTYVVFLGVVVLTVVGVCMELKEKEEKQNRKCKDKKQVSAFQGRCIDYNAEITDWYAEVAVLDLEGGIYQKFCVRNRQLESKTKPIYRSMKLEDATELLFFQCTVEFAGRQWFLEIDNKSTIYKFAFIRGVISRMINLPDEKIKLCVVYSDSNDKEFLIWDFLTMEGKSNFGKISNQIAEAIRKKANSF